MISAATIAAAKMTVRSSAGSGTSRCAAAPIAPMSAPMLMVLARSRRAITA